MNANERESARKPIMRGLGIFTAVGICTAQSGPYQVRSGDAGCGEGLGFDPGMQDSTPVVVPCSVRVVLRR